VDTPFRSFIGSLPSLLTPGFRLFSLMNTQSQSEIHNLNIFTVASAREEDEAIRNPSFFEFYILYTVPSSAFHEYASGHPIYTGKLLAHAEERLTSPRNAAKCSSQVQRLKMAATSSLRQSIFKSPSYTVSMMACILSCAAA
jgi:hypothetical protein